MNSTELIEIFNYDHTSPLRYFLSPTSPSDNKLASIFLNHSLIAIYLRDIIC